MERDKDMHHKYEAQITKKLGIQRIFSKDGNYIDSKGMVVNPCALPGGLVGIAASNVHNCGHERIELYQNELNDACSTAKTLGAGAFEMKLFPTYHNAFVYMIQFYKI